jgi:nucleoside-triphosphatase THEP1
MDEAIINHENRIFRELQKEIQKSADSGKSIFDFKMILSEFLRNKFEMKGFHTKPLIENGKIIGYRIFKSTADKAGTMSLTNEKASDKAGTMSLTNKEASIKSTSDKAEAISSIITNKEAFNKPTDEEIKPAINENIESDILKFNELMKKIQEGVDSGESMFDFKMILSEFLINKLKTEGFHTRSRKENGKIIGYRIWRRRDTQN